MNNYEKIMMSMTPKKMAKICADTNKCPPITPKKCLEYEEKHSRTTKCFFCWTDWFKSEAEVEL